MRQVNSADGRYATVTVEGCKSKDGDCDWKAMEAKALKEAQQKANDIAVKTAEERAKNLVRRAALPSAKIDMGGSDGSISSGRDHDNTSNKAICSIGTE